MDLRTSIGVHDAFTEPLKNMTNALNITISSFEELQRASSNTVDTTSLRTARDELAKAEIAFSDIGTEVKDNTVKQKQFNDELNVGNSNAGSLLSTIGKIGAAIGVGMMFRDGFNVFKHFEQEMANLEAVTGATERQMEALNYQAKHMGETTVFSASQSAEGMKELAKGGLEVQQIIEAIPSTLDLAVVSQMSLAEASATTVDIMAGFNLEADQIGRVVDTIAYASNNATTDIRGMGEAFAYSAKILDTYGASIEESAGIIAMMSPVAKGSRAGTSIRSGIGKIASPTEDAKQWLDQLQVDFTDPATGQINSLTDNVDQLAVAFEGLDPGQQIEAGKAIFGEQAYAAWLAVIQEGEGAVQRWVDEFNTSAVDTAQTMKEIMLSTTDGILQIHKSEVESIWINFYEGLADGVVGEAFQSVLKGMRRTLEIGLTLATGAITLVGHGIQFLANAFDILAPIVVAAAVAYGLLNIEMLAGVGLAIKDLAIKALQVAKNALLAGSNIALGMATFFATVQTQGLAAALMLLPWNWVLAGIVLVIGALYAIVAAYNKVAGTSVSATGIMIGSVFAVGAAIYNVIALAWNLVAAFIEFAVNVWKHPEYAAKMAWYNISLAVMDFVVAGSDLLQGFLNTAVRVANAIQEAFVTAFNWIVTQAQKVSFSIPGWVPGIGGKEFTLLGDVEMKTVNPIEAPDVVGWATDVRNSIKKPDLPDDYIKIPRMESKNLMEAYNSGYDRGEALGNKVSDFFSFGTEEFDMDKFMQEEMDGLDNLNALDPMSPGGLGDTLGDIANNTGKTAGSAKGIKDKMDATEEDIKYLRDLASQTVMNRFTTNEIKVINNNDMKVDSKLDLDGIVNDLATGIEDTLEYRLEGI